ncbi:heterokaryon incompatibility protein-domain-containing protein [Chaetomium sp. MPI-SDFR-AT-0129]|nr:heterokaryon incompatibility protein-domain-containing protein [Chaetomium sp. MPI-SDFR-AT-0129]
MRLLDVRTFELCEFVGKPPPYAILSHTWEDDEVTFQDIANLDLARKKKGFTKIQLCCEQALHDDYDWAWVDTCCIDKSSSAELSETINSMFKWYNEAETCYAFLSDMAPLLDEEQPRSPHQFENRGNGLRASGPEITELAAPPRYPRFMKSRWWTRGWTLQELIAPPAVEFYDRDWQHITCKDTCKELISAATRIDRAILSNADYLSVFPVAERISWVAERNTTREEDMAYCLLGLLNVNMPLLYGEGARKAFRRLQEHVISSREDSTLFLWDAASHPPLFTNGTILAPSPRHFSGRKVWEKWYMGSYYIGEPPQMTSRGLRVSLFIKQLTEEDKGTYERLVPHHRATFQRMKTSPVGAHLRSGRSRVELYAHCHLHCRLFF